VVKDEDRTIKKEDLCKEQTIVKQ